MHARACSGSSGRGSRATARTRVRSSSGRRNGRPTRARPHLLDADHLDVCEALVQQGDGVHDHGRKQAALRRNQLGVERRAGALLQNGAHLPCSGVTNVRGGATAPEGGVSDRRLRPPPPCVVAATLDVAAHRAARQRAEAFTVGLSAQRTCASSVALTLSALSVAMATSPARRSPRMITWRAQRRS